ncbi:MAG: hypothetical protein ACKV2O_22770 [Acidimicrobiales bacterium]
MGDEPVMDDDPRDIDTVIRRIIGGDVGTRCWIRRRSDSLTDPRLLIMAALLDPHPARIERALAACGTTGDRQAVAIAVAHLRGDHQLVDALARDHLVDHPGSVLVAWIAAGAVHQ